MLRKNKDEGTIFITPFDFSAIKKYITFGGKKYYFDIEAFKKVCLFSGNEKNTETEITEAYEVGDTADNDNMLYPTSKIVREVKTNGNSQNDTIVYDFVKMVLLKILECPLNEYNSIMDFSTALSFNTLIKYGILKEIND